MSKIHVFSRLVATTAAAFTLTSGCVMTSDDAREDTSSLRQANSAISDEDLFREILFPNAASAAKVPELGRIYDAVHFDQLDQAQLDAITTFQDVLITRINEIDPTFFAAFRDDVTSGDVLRVDAAMTDAHEMMTEAVGSLSAEFSALTQSGSLDALREGLVVTTGPDPVDILDHIEHLDPDKLQLLNEVFLQHLEMFDIPLDPNLGIDTMVGIQASTQLSSMVDVQVESNQQADPLVNIYYQVEVAVWAYVAAAVAAAAVAAVVVVVVLVAAAPFGTAQYINGESMALYRDQLIFNITEAYAA